MSKKFDRALKLKIEKLKFIIQNRGKEGQHIKTSQGFGHNAIANGPLIGLGQGLFPAKEPSHLFETFDFILYYYSFIWAILLFIFFRHLVSSGSSKGSILEILPRPVTSLTVDIHIFSGAERWFRWCCKCKGPCIRHSFDSIQRLVTYAGMCSRKCPQKKITRTSASCEQYSYPQSHGHTEVPLIKKVSVQDANN